jgi:hypothetical protein
MDGAVSLQLSVKFFQNKELPDPAVTGLKVPFGNLQSFGHVLLLFSLNIG